MLCVNGSKGNRGRRGEKWEGGGTSSTGKMRTCAAAVDSRVAVPSQLAENERRERDESQTGDLGFFREGS